MFPASKLATKMLARSFYLLLENEPITDPKIQSILELLTPGAQPRRSMRRSLVQAAMLVLAEHDLKCDPDAPLILGREEEFFDDRDENCRYCFDIWVAYGIISLLIKCPGDQHARVGAAATNAILCSFRRYFSGGQIISKSNKRSQIVNNLECNSRFEKEDDGSFHIVGTASQDHLALSIEVAFNHEDVHVLLCEASSWLHTSTCSYALIIKSWKDRSEIGLGFMLLRRLQPKNEEYLPQGYMASPRGSTGQNRYCGNVPDFPEFTGPRSSWLFPQDPERIREYYHMDVVKSFYARSLADLECIVLDLHFMLEEIDHVPFPQIEDNVIEVDFRDEFQRYFEIFHSVPVSISSECEDTDNDDIVELVADTRRRSKRIRRKKPDNQ